MACFAAFIIFLYFTLLDPVCIKFVGPSPRDVRTIIHLNVFLTVFYTDHISQHLWKTVGTTFQCIIVLQSRGECPEK